MMAEQDYYELLGVSRGADLHTIKAAYRKMAKECHPDKHNGCSEKEAHFKAISEAYDCLRDPQKRAAYDRFGKAAFQNGAGGAQDPFGAAGFEGFSDIFSSIFGEFMDRNGGGRVNPARGADLRYDLELSLEEAFAGKEATVTVDALSACETCGGRGCTATENCARTCGTCGGMGKVRAQQGFFVVERGCPTCRGSGEVIADPCRACEGEGRTINKRKLTVKIPAGVDEGTRIRVAGEGEAGVRNAPNGDLYIFVHMKRHPVYAREGTTLIADCPVTFTTAALGGTITLPGLDGAKVEMKVPAGAQSGEQLRQRGAGMSVLNGRGRGDLVARIIVETPTRMSSKQKKLLEEFRSTETGDECPAAKGFFGRVRDMLGG
ncbi:molecular chaperone DnaJ [Sphingomonas sp. RG327]|jgi:molecular chaperone DnaJ|uniref:Chaperone protein DnaJ n=1 Tax=Sphingomonas anseongensis TaxID=2908207 RepID=A0ABT0RDP4_9SPHN|nr:molecular chaperone DnaJ [Sphingomonas anseongensis]MCL6678376.1 molecular chaperone DnaJ [Sphingomonas anseongensis]